VLATTGDNRVSSGSPSVGESSSAESSERLGEPERNTRYALIGPGMGVFALMIIAWRIREECMTVSTEIVKAEETTRYIFSKLRCNQRRA
jgi:hypothetical protein